MEKEKFSAPSSSSSRPEIIHKQLKETRDSLVLKLEQDLDKYLINALPLDAILEGENLYSDGEKLFIQLSDDRYFVFNPNHIQFITTGYSLEHEIEEQTGENINTAIIRFRNEGWVYVGVEKSASHDDGELFSEKHLFARPWITEAPYTRIPGVDVYIYKNTEQQFVGEDGSKINTRNVASARSRYDLVVQAGTLQVHVKMAGLARVNSDQKFNAAEIDIIRPPDAAFLLKEGSGVFHEKVSLMARNPTIARATFMSEMSAALMQLQNLGFEQLIGRPSDDRRKRIYRLAGMEYGKVATEILFGDITNILAKRYRISTLAGSNESPHDVH